MGLQQHCILWCVNALTCNLLLLLGQNILSLTRVSLYQRIYSLLPLEKLFFQYNFRVRSIPVVSKMAQYVKVHCQVGIFIRLSMLERHFNHDFLHCMNFLFDIFDPTCDHIFYSSHPTESENVYLFLFFAKSFFFCFSRKQMNWQILTTA